ncbi:MAG: hypothetical protein J6S02_07605 [Bacteroidaceae bacterium]|nr:hypothetical protein [Bacteroidaceae bacterium]
MFLTKSINHEQVSPYHIKGHPKKHRHHPHQDSVVTIMFHALVEQLSIKCTVTKHAQGFLSELKETVYKHLQQGDSVRYGDLGWFHAFLSSYNANSL